MVQRILVTGGAGFIGSHTVDLLLQHQYEVVVFDNLSSGKRDYLDLKHPRLYWFEGDIRNEAALQEALRGCDAVLHLAALASVPQSINHPIESHMINTVGFLHLLEAIRLAARPIRFVYASSAAVYGESAALPCSDTLPLTAMPLSPYALQKMHDEHYAALYAQLFGVRSLALRYFNVYGPRQDPDSPYSGVISRFVQAISRQEALTLLGDGLQSRDFIYVADVARANQLALQSTVTGAINVATGQPSTLLALIACMEATLGHSITIKEAPPRPGDVLSSYGTVLRAKQALQFHAAFSLQTGIDALLR